MKLKILKFLDGMLNLFLKVFSSRLIPHKNTSKILVIKLSAMGDAISLFPALRRLANADKNFQVDWLTTARTNPGLFENFKFINKIYVMPTSLGSLCVFILKNIKIFRNYDLIIDFDQYYKFSELISCLGKSNAGFRTKLKGSTFGIGVTYLPAYNEKLMFNKLVTEVLLILEKKYDEYDIYLPELLEKFYPNDSINKIEKYVRNGKPTVVLYPGSSNNASFRRWPLENYIYLIEKLNKNFNFIIAGGKDEISLKRKISSLGYAEFDYIDQFTIFEWLWIFKNLASLFVGNDAGLLHLAESQKLPIIGIYGPNISAKWGSINLKSTSFEVNLECRPCIKNSEGIIPQSCARQDVLCLDLIKPDLICKAIISKLED